MSCQVFEQSLSNAKGTHSFKRTSNHHVVMAQCGADLKSASFETAASKLLGTGRSRRPNQGQLESNSVDSFGALVRVSCVSVVLCGIGKEQHHMRSQPFLMLRMMFVR